MTEPALRVLLVEDDIGDAVLVKRALQDCTQEFELKHCECLEDAIDALHRSRFDVALLDISLPDSFGLTALAKIQPLAPGMPIVVLTGLSDDELALQFLEQGAQDYIVKENADSQLLERSLRHAIQRQQIQTENHRLLQEMEILARHDALTSVLNRRSFAECLEILWQTTERYGHSLACIVLDIDFFKRVNDTFGHSVGDEVLKEVAATLSGSTRATDFIGRLGGEEFCVLLPEISEEQALVWAERIRRQIESLVFPVEDNEVRVTISLGVASYNSEMSQPQTLVDRADEAMFVAKQLGRNQCFLSSSDSGNSDESANQMWNDIQIENLMRPIRNSLDPGQTVEDAIDLMQAGNIDSIPVVNQFNTLVGVIGEDDIVTALLSTETLDLSVGDIMNTQLVTYPIDTPTREVCEFLCRTPVRQVFVTIDDEPIGIVRRNCLLDSIPRSKSGKLGTGSDAISQVIS